MHLLLIGISLVICIMIFSIIIKYLNLWIQALASGVPIGIPTLFMMQLRKVNPRVIVTAQIMAAKAGINISTNLLEAHFLAGGNVHNVIRALIAADKANIALNFAKAAAIDLAGRDVLEAVKTSVNPKVINCPKPSDGRDTIDAVAKDGIQLKAKARVTVRTNIEALIGGATEDTVIARVGEGIVTSIGSSNSHKDVLENPDIISKNVLARGLDTGTAYEILSIDIADIDVGENIGAKLQAEQAQADMRIAQAKAEERRAMAVAAEQENLATIQEMKARVVEAEAKIPLAIADAFNKGNLGVMDYYSMKNIMADTEMRSSIARPEQKDKSK
ncbi:flotillin-like protein FloA [bacterium]|nr:flotillin-like protein FloA [bacterium]MCP5462515.1 flotillin-like protein FloA [bacterium]